MIWEGMFDHDRCSRIERTSYASTRLICIMALISMNTVTALRMPTSFSTNSPWFSRPSKLSSTTASEESVTQVPTRGLIDYIGNTKTKNGEQRWQPNGGLIYRPPTKSQKFQTRFNLWKQYPWKKFKGKAILAIKLSGSLPLESSGPTGLLAIGAPKDYLVVDSLQELTTMFTYAAYDPRIKAVFVDLGRLACGYAKLQEVRRSMEFFRQCGKQIIGYCEGGAEKELYTSLFFDEFYVPPDGGIDLRGFSGGASFVRGVLDKIGIEPQVQRIGKYKSAGDNLNRTSIAKAQREVVSSLLTEASDYWVDILAQKKNKTAEEVRSLWSEPGVKTPYDLKEMGYVTGVRYLDQVGRMLMKRYGDVPKRGPFSFFQGKKNATADDKEQDDKDDSMMDFDLKHEFEKFPRRNSSGALLSASMNNTTAASNVSADAPNATYTNVSTSSLSPSESIEKDKKKKANKRSLPPSIGVLPGGLYLRKMRKGAKILQGLPLKEAVSGPRVAIINAVGGINSGESGNSGVSGKTLGSDTFIAQVKRAKRDPSIKAVVIRVDSPGGSALASDLMWREVRSLAREKPVVASMVDVAASGGYYISMACDEIVAEELSITGSIGVVTAKFNAEKLNEKIGFTTETLSIGRYAEVLSTSRGFTEDEYAYFEENARKAYTSFITKAAASRSMDVEAMNEVAQGRVWTGKQAERVGLVDHMGGLSKAVMLAASLCEEGSFRLSSSRSRSRSRKSTLTTASRTSSSTNITETALDSGKIGTLSTGMTAEEKYAAALNAAESATAASSNGTKQYLSVYDVRVQTIKEPKRGFFGGAGGRRGASALLPFPFSTLSSSSSSSFDFSRVSDASAVGRMSLAEQLMQPLALCDEAVVNTNLASLESLGMATASSSFSSNVGAGGSVAGLLAKLMEVTRTSSVLGSHLMRTSGLAEDLDAVAQIIAKISSAGNGWR